ncbi:MAG: alkaline phosphatase D family protein [Cyclobacteriaceae bacterium]|nr:alkaline phosphatase D family protein [Cyclobacteriaceae bacterium]
MKKLPFKILLSLMICYSSFVNVYGQAGNIPFRDGIQFSPRWLDNLMFLNHFDKELPKEKQVLYKWAETVLACEVHKGFADLASNREFQRHCEMHNIKLLGGPMLGNISSNAVSVWVRTVKPAHVAIIVAGDKKELKFGPVTTKPESELSAVVQISGLKPNTAYRYTVIVDNEKIEHPYETSFKTLSDSKEINTRIVFGSCFHRWGLGNEKQSNTIINRNPHAFLGLGDIAVQDKNNRLGWHSLDFLARDLYPAWQNLVSKIPFYAIWDDHDYFDDDKGGVPNGFSPIDRDNVWRAFRYSWNNPNYGLETEGGGVFFRTRIGAADIIMLDGRFFREPGNYLGDKQMDWLKKQLLDCNGPFIILANGSMWSDYVSSGKDSWGVYDPIARESIFNLIEENNIGGVLLISGDRHGARGFRIPRPSGFNFFEFEVASLGGLSGQPASMPEWDTQFYGISGGYAFGEFTFDLNHEDPIVTFRLIGENGEYLHEMTVKRSELTPANFR